MLAAAQRAPKNAPGVGNHSELFSDPVVRRGGAWIGGVSCRAIRAANAASVSGGRERGEWSAWVTPSHFPATNLSRTCWPKATFPTGTDAGEVCAEEARR